MHELVELVPVKMFADFCFVENLGSDLVNGDGF
jgi:hypothetical protein